MSDLMLLGILRMPLDLWQGDPCTQMQLHGACIEAADRIEKMQAQIDRLMGCRICGGLVDLQGAVKPTAHVGVGRKLGRRQSKPEGQ